MKSCTSLFAAVYACSESSVSGDNSSECSVCLMRDFGSTDVSIVSSTWSMGSRHVIAFIFLRGDVFVKSSTCSFSLSVRVAFVTSSKSKSDEAGRCSYVYCSKSQALGSLASATHFVEINKPLKPKS